MPYRILLCDDEPHIVRAAEMKLRRAGYLVRSAFDGEDAWRQVEDERPDLLVTDCQMPRLDGIGLVARLRADERFADLPVVMLTAKELELSRSGLLDGKSVLAVLGKPFSPRELQQTIERILGKSSDDVHRLKSLQPVG